MLINKIVITILLILQLNFILISKYIITINAINLVKLNFLRCLIKSSTIRKIR